MKQCVFLHFVLLLTISTSLQENNSRLPGKWQSQLDDHQDHVDQILQYLTVGDGKHQTYDKLSLLTDAHPSRFSATDGLEDAIDYLLEELEEEGFDNVHSEDVQVPHWVRGSESATILQPRKQEMAILGLGTSIGTPPGGITAQVIVVHSFTELEQKADLVEGKIVVFNQPWTNYFHGRQYRTDGASRASVLGAVAVLIRSVASLSVYSSHTGIQKYAENITKIPAACITVEDAELLQRMYDRGLTIEVNLQMEARNEDPKTSRNVIAEIRGSVYPEEFVIFGGHIDNWDVGTGAVDDGSGVCIAWQILSTIKSLGLKPKRTMRAVIWTDEEVLVSGGKEYFRRHKDENVSLAMESDTDPYKPKGVGFVGSGLTRSIIEEILQLLSVIGTTEIAPFPIGTTDVQEWPSVGVPIVGLYTDDEKYFYYHHSKGDTLSAVDPDHLDLCSVVFTTVAYVVADLDDMLPRDGDYVPPLETPPPLGAGNPCINTATAAQASILTIIIMYFI